MSLGHKIGAYAELLRRYGAVFRHFWTHRDRLGDRMLREHEAEFLPAALAIQERPVSPAARRLAMALIGLIAAVLLWAIVGELDIVVNAAGRIVPGARTKTIGSVDVASVRALHVEEGRSVKAGDVLIELDSSAPDAEHDKASGDRIAALLQAARSQALIAALDDLRPPHLARIGEVPQDEWRAAQRHLDGQYHDFLAKLRRIDGDIERYRLALPLATQRAEDYKTLAADHDVSQHAYLEKEQARIDLQGQLVDTQHQRTALIEETRRLAYDQWTEASKVAAASGQDALRAGSHSRLLKLTAPVDGTVQQLTVHTVGGVVPAAQPLMQIVPAEDLVEVEAWLENKDVGFVSEGQHAEVKVDTFEYTKYGTIPARVTHVSRDAVQDEKKGLIYAAKIVLDRSTIDVDGHPVKLAPGMAVSVEIATGTRRVIEYVLSPLLRHKRESLNER